MDAVRINGGDKIALLAKHLRQLGTDRTIINEMARNIRRSAPGLRGAVRASALSTLPRRGGLNAWVAASGIRVAVTRGQRNAGVTLVVGRNAETGKRSDVARIDAGSTRHPLWGNRHHWYPQAVVPGFASKVIDGPAAAQFVRDAEAAIDTAVERVLHGI